MIIGLFLTVMILFMAPTVLKVFSVKNSDGYAAKYIFVKVGNIVNCVTTWVVRVVKDYPNNNPFGDIESPYSVSQSVWDHWNNWIVVSEL